MVIVVLSWLALFGFDLGVCRAMITGDFWFSGGFF